MNTERVDQYELPLQLGSGGMAEVWLARDTHPHDGMRRELALKRVRRDLLGNKGVVAAFRREAQLSSSLNHPNLVNVHAQRVMQADPYIVMEYIHGLTLSELSKRLPRLPSEQAETSDESETYEAREPLPLDVIIYIVDQLLAALAYLHAHEYEVNREKQSGAIHRDVSPQNIMVSVEGHVKLMDLGVARGTQQETEGGAKGKLRYMPPEQYRRPKDVTSAVDIFAVGAVLHELLDGREFRQKNFDLDSVPELACASTIPAELDALRLAMLEFDPKLRPTASEARERLDTLGVSMRASTRLAELVKQYYTAPRLTRVSQSLPIVRKPEQTNPEAGAAPSLSTDAGDHAPAEEEDTLPPARSLRVRRTDEDDSNRGMLLGAIMALTLVLVFVGVVMFVDKEVINDIIDGADKEDDSSPVVSSVIPSRPPVTPPEDPDVEPVTPPEDPDVEPVTPPEDPNVGPVTLPDPPEPGKPGKKKDAKPKTPPSLPLCSKSEESQVKRYVEDTLRKKECGEVTWLANGRLQPKGKESYGGPGKPKQACVVTFPCPS